MPAVNEADAREIRQIMDEFRARLEELRTEMDRLRIEVARIDRLRQIDMSLNPHGQPI
jgi:hypothetical protein